ncbi:MAG: Pectate lyase 3 protein, partial [Patescibacteria group bacterium]|nr:Pectate lyase 3 protein [Patescibacteria group bacterium]
SISSLNIPSGTAPSSPVDGDIWFDGTDIKMRIGGTTKTFTLT